MNEFSLAPEFMVGPTLARVGSSKFGYHPKSLSILPPPQVAGANSDRRSMGRTLIVGGWLRDRHCERVHESQKPAAEANYCRKRTSSGKAFFERHRSFCGNLINFEPFCHSGHRAFRSYRRSDHPSWNPRFTNDWATETSIRINHDPSTLPQRPPSYRNIRFRKIKSSVKTRGDYPPKSVLVFGHIQQVNIAGRPDYFQEN